MSSLLRFVTPLDSSGPPTLLSFLPFLALSFPLFAPPTLCRPLAFSPSRLVSLRQSGTPSLISLPPSSFSLPFPLSCFFFTYTLPRLPSLSSCFPYAPTLPLSLFPSPIRVRPFLPPSRCPSLPLLGPLPPSFPSYTGSPPVSPSAVPRPPCLTARLVVRLRPKGSC